MKKTYNRYMAQKRICAECLRWTKAADSDARVTQMARDVITDNSSVDALQLFQATPLGVGKRSCSAGGDAFGTEACVVTEEFQG